MLRTGAAAPVSVIDTGTNMVSATVALAAGSGPAALGKFIAEKRALWGVDSLDVVDQSFFDAVKQAGIAPPAFWGRYIGKTGNLTSGEVALLHRNNCKVLVIYRDTTLGQLKSKARAIEQAKAAIKAAQNLGVPNGVWIYADTEFPSQSPTAEWFAGWFETLQRFALRGWSLRQHFNRCSAEVR